MPAWLIRHAQSTANAGAPSDTPTNTSITDLGRKQAQEVADWFTEKPDLVVASPYIRTQQTAEPLVERFKPAQDIWPVQEFTYLNPELYRGTTQAQRTPFVNEYWLRNDPHHRDGNSESFVDFIQRCYSLIERLEALKGKNVVVYTHGRFIQGSTGCWWKVGKRTTTPCATSAGWCQTPA